MKQLPAGVLVFSGGGIGATLRYLFTLVLPDATFPQSTLFINLFGALILGFLTAILADSRTPRARTLRLGLGTGMMGGFTTYSTFALQNVELIGQGYYMLSVAYILVSLAFGALFCWLGFTLAARLKGRPSP